MASIHPGSLLVALHQASGRLILRIPGTAPDHHAGSLLRFRHRICAWKGEIFLWFASPYYDRRISRFPLKQCPAVHSRPS